MLTLFPAPDLRLPLPARRQVDVWQIDLDDAGWQPHGTVLAADEEQRAARFLREQPRTRFRHGRAALRHVLAAYADGDPCMLITYTQFGKPQLAAGGLHFNVSHSDGLALLAVGAVDLGIDLESLRRTGFDINPLDRQICSAVERELLQGLPAPHRAAALFRLWTQKEAWSKSSGHGLQRDFRSVTVEACADAACCLIRYEGRVLHVHDLPMDDGWCASLCHPEPVIEVQRRLARPHITDGPPRSA